MSIASHATAPDLDALATLRRRIADVERGDVRPTFGFPTGVGALDAALHATGGVPRGRLTELLGADGSGTTTLVRRLVARTLAGGTWVAYVDATRTLAPRDWAGLGRRGVVTERGVADLAGVDPSGFGAPERLWVVRPPDATRAAWCADVLLRSGGFGLVVVDGAPVLSRAVALRLLQLARDADAALVLLGAGTRASDLSGALRLRVRAAPGGYGGHAPPHGPSVPAAPASAAGRRWRAAPEGSGWHAVQRTVITVEKGGSHRTVEVSCAVGVARRLCAHPEVPDRRPVARPTGSGGHADVGRGPDAADPGAAGGGTGGGTVNGTVDGVLSDPVRWGRRAGESTLGRHRTHR